MWDLMTLDGFVEGPNRDISFHLDVWGEELERLSIEQGRSAGGLMFGRVTYELMANYWPNESGEVADFMNALPKYVFSRTLTHSDWRNTQLFNDDLPATAARLKRDSAKDIFIFGSADLCAGLIPHGLIDEFRIGICPILLGSGTPLFKPGEERIKLKLLDARALSTGIVINRYEPRAA
jgi:dihydrofolate reductase